MKTYSIAQMAEINRASIATGISAQEIICILDDFFVEIRSPIAPLVLINHSAKSSPCHDYTCDHGGAMAPAVHLNKHREMLAPHKKQKRCKFKRRG